MENLDIKDFQSVSSVSELDNILLVQSTGVNGKMTVALFKTAVRNDVTPSIKENVWWIGTVNTGIVAAGKTPEFRKGDLGIEWKYTTDTAWKLLVNYESISLTFDDLTEAQKNSLKLHFSDLTGGGDSAVAAAGPGYDRYPAGDEHKRDGCRESSCRSGRET